MSDGKTDSKRAIGSDLIIPVAASLYAIYYVGSVWDFPAEAQRSGLFLATMLLGLSAIFFVRTAMGVFRNGARLDFSAVLGPEEGRRGRFAFFGLVLAYLGVVQYGGFTLSTFAFLFAGSLVSGLRPISKAFIFAATAAITGWLFFIVLLGTRFPVGPFEKLISLVIQAWK